MTIPVWFLDVDGVINAVTKTPDDTIWHYQQSMVKSRSGYFPIAWSQDVVRFISFMQSAQLADVRWLTTWADDANLDLADQLGLPQLPVAGWPQHKTRWWKADVIKQWARENPDVPFIWTDDDLRWEENMLAWCEAEASTRPVLVLSPDTKVGLTNGDLDRVAKFVANLADLELG